MDQIRLYDRDWLREFLEKTGIAVELFEGWTSSQIAGHSHDILEMNFILKGVAEQEVEGEVSELTEDTLTIVNYGQSHRITTLGSPIDIVNIYLDLKKMRLKGIPERLKPTLQEILPLHPAFGHNLNRIVQVDISDHKTELQNLILGIWSEQNKKSEGYQEAICDYFALALLLICRSAQKKWVSNADSHKSFEKLERLLAYINENFHKELDLELLSDYIGLNKSYLCREFKKATSKTIMQYIAERRIEKAMFDLRTTSKKVVNIALDSGFQDCSNFNRCFKKFAGLSPVAYRKKFTV